MNTGIFIIFTLLGIMLLTVLGLNFTRRFTTRAAHKFAESVGVELTVELLPTVRARLALRQRGATIGGLVALFTTALLLINDAKLSESTFGPLAVAGIIFTGMCVGRAVVATRPHSPSSPHQPRIARSSSVSLPDYISPLERRGSFTAAALAIIAASIFVVASYATHARLGPWFSGPVILAILSVAALIVFGVTARRILQKGQPAGSPVELRWDDALRAQRLRGLMSAPLVLGAYGTLTSLAETAETFTRVGEKPLAVGFADANLAFAIIAIVISIIALISTPQRQFLRRLWPEPAGAA